ncbi:MAG: SDR family oxidoreductase [Chloroflexota bacterium]|nr:SDR family oxidoreductase [Chloroflexota bacterium]
MRPIEEQVIVITGGSSGIGRATALEAVRRGARVAITARGQEALESARREIEAAGGPGSVLAVPADVADFEQVRELCRRAVERFGRIDTWVNNASVSIYAEFAQITPPEFQQVLNVNVMGVVHGAMVALEQMKSQEGGGTIVNIASGLGDRAVPLQSPYSMAKFAVDGFSEALRVELERGDIPVQVTVIKPSSINTPFFRNARTKMGVKARPLPPVYEPELVAEAILYAAVHPVRELQVGSPAVLMSLQQVAPRLMDWPLRRLGYAGQQSETPKAETDRDNLFEGAPGPGAIHGEWRARRFSAATWLSLHPVVRRAALGGVAAFAGLALARRNGVV